MDRPRTEPRDVFMYLLAMSALYVSVYAVITLLFQYVNLFFPDPLDSAGYGSQDARCNRCRPGPGDDAGGGYSLTSLAARVPAQAATGEVQ